MTYNIDLRSRVISFVSSGGSRKKASRYFKVSIWCVHDWCRRGEGNLEARQHGRRNRKLNWGALKQHIEVHPAMLLRERAAHFEVHISAIWYACRQMALSHKKNATFPRKEPPKVGQLSAALSSDNSEARENRAYPDESGFISQCCANISQKKCHLFSQSYHNLIIKTSEAIAYLLAICQSYLVATLCFSINIRWRT